MRTSFFIGCSSSGRKENRVYTNGYVQLLYWKSKKQPPSLSGNESDRRFSPQQTSHVSVSDQLLHHRLVPGMFLYRRKQAPAKSLSFQTLVCFCSFFSFVIPSSFLSMFSLGSVKFTETNFLDSLSDVCCPSQLSRAPHGRTFFFGVLVKQQHRLLLCVLSFCKNLFL